VLYEFAVERRLLARPGKPGEPSLIVIARCEPIVGSSPFACVAIDVGVSHPPPFRWLAPESGGAAVLPSSEA